MIRGAAALTLGLVLWFTGCTKRAPVPAPGGSPPVARPRVALVMKSLANEFFKTMEDGVRQHQRTHAGAYDLITNGIKDEQDVGKQIDMVEQMVAQGVQAIVLAPADSKALVGAVRHAIEANVVVVNIDNKLDETVLKERHLRVPFVGPDNRVGARAVGAHLAQSLRRGDPVAIIEGLPTAWNASERRAGFQDAVKAAGLTLVASQAGNWEMTRANQVAAALLTEHPDLKGFLCANDSMALGVVAALRAAGKAGQIQVVGFDNIAAVQTLIRKKEILATADQHGASLAVFGIEAALDILAKKAPAEDRNTAVDLVTAETLR